MPDPKKLVLMSNGSDDWLRGARKKVHTETLVWDEAKVAAEWTTRAADPTSNPDVVELISHSIAEPEARRYLLKVNQWVVDDTAFSAYAGMPGAGSGSKKLYIAGCLTAEGPVAHKALTALEARLGVEVWGTNRVLGDYDLDENGCRADLTELWVRPAVTPIGSTPQYAVNGMSLRAAGARLRPFDPQERERLFAGLPAAIQAWLTSLIDFLTPPLAYEFPGMLTVPTTSVRFVISPSERGQVDALFGGRLVRVLRVASSGARVELLFPVGSRWRADVSERFGRAPRP